MLNPLADRTELLEGEAKQRTERNRAYMLRLKTENILFSHYFEAGLKSYSYKPENIHWGWDSPTSEIRGTFAGHWLSAAALLYAQTKDLEIKQRADFMVSEIGRCQRENGGRWAFPIPEKYLYWLKRKKNIWAPQYVCHKNMMGLLDMYVHAGNEEALDIVLKCADWFYEYTSDISRELMNEMMEMQETGGMMMHWANLYAVTGDEKHLELMRRYERPLLFEPLLRGEDVLTNMHANTTVPEVLGAARAYEVTGEDRYRRIVENYWKIAVENRGSFATGGQSSGEVWTPPGRFAARLGKMTQEHCLVYHMMMLAEFLFRWTGERRYADYWEKNLYNGIFAQGYWQQHTIFQLKDPIKPKEGLVTYYLPLAAGSKKKWGSETEDFWCCHCTLLQANAVHNRSIYYIKDDTVTVAQYIPSKTSFVIDGREILLIQTIGHDTGETIRILPQVYKNQCRPDSFLSTIKINIDEGGAKDFTLSVRVPAWITGDACVRINGAAISGALNDRGFIDIHKSWSSGDIVTVELPKGIYCEPLPDRKDTVAFMEGPVVLAGLCDHEHMLFGDIHHPETMLAVEDERMWNSWNNYFKTVNQPVGIKFKPLYEIGDEAYTVYFQVKNSF